MSKNKCRQCGIVNLSEDKTCRRCGASLSDEQSNESRAAEETIEPRSIGSRLLWIAGTTTLLLFIAYMSLLLTSADLNYEQRNTVNAAVVLLEQDGFGKQAFVLNWLVRYRGTDSWWNRYVGHRDAYAATNFPFEVLTLYPEFFQHSVDDNERAAILLHEAYHLLGSGEDAALEGVWRNKQRLGWTAEKYGHTKVWINTRDLTMAHVPNLFSCGPDGKSDCTQ